MGHETREDMMRAAANSLGFEFIKEAEVGFGYNVEAMNSMSGRKSGVAVDIFNFEIERSETRSEDRSGILISGFEGDLPSFALFPETPLNTETGFLKLDLDFKSHPGFSNAYILHAGDDGDVRAFFNEDVLEYFDLNTELEITVRNNTLFFSYPPMYSVLEIEASLEKALEVKDVLEKAACDEKFRQRVLNKDADVEQRHKARVNGILGYPVALLCWGCAAFIWYEAGFETAAPLIVLMAVGGGAAFAAGFFKGPDVDTDMSSDKYSPWKS